jgi:hypothetical protein
MSTLKTNTLSNVAGTSSTAIENAIHGSAKAWVNFNGTGTVAIRAQYNVSSITDNGVGDYTVNFTTAMSDANYSVVGTSLAISTTDFRGCLVTIQGGFNTGPTSMTTSGVRIATGGTSIVNQPLDSVTNCVTIFR